MFINKDSIIINGISMGQYLLSAKYEYNKLWGTDTGRNLAGVMTGTLVGIFPKLILTFKSMTKAEMNIIAPILDSATQTVTYYDPSINGNVLTVVFSESLGQVAIEVSTASGAQVDCLSVLTPNGLQVYIPNSGNYIVTFTLSDGDEYYGEFTITD